MGRAFLRRGRSPLAEHMHFYPLTSISPPFRFSTLLRFSIIPRLSFITPSTGSSKPSLDKDSSSKIAQRVTPRWRIAGTFLFPLSASVSSSSLLPFPLIASLGSVRATLFIPRILVRDDSGGSSSRHV